MPTQYLRLNDCPDVDRSRCPNTPIYTLARRSQQSWRFECAKTRIDVNYYDIGIVIADAALCTIPMDKIEKLYEGTSKNP
jgi:hypothetical protein